jgi:hypothetical protein
MDIRFENLVALSLQLANTHIILQPLQCLGAKYDYEEFEMEN